MILPIIRKYWKLLLATMLITAIGCGFTIGLSSAYLTLEQTMNDYLARYGYPDASITTEVTNRGKLDAIEKVPGVEVVNARLCADTVVQDEGGRYLSVRVFSQNDDDVETFYYHETADGDGRDEMLLEYNFAEANGIHAGDTLRIQVGNEWRDVFVSGLVSRPETLTVQPTNDSWDLNADFGYAYASVHLLAAEYDKVYNQTKGDLDAAKENADRELQNAREQLDEAGAALREKEQLLADSEMEASAKKEEAERTREELERNRASLVDERARLVLGRSAATSALSELRTQLSLLNEASEGLASIDEQLDTLNGQYDALTSSDVVNAVNLLRQVPRGLQIQPLITAVANFQNLISSAEAYGFYYNVTDTVATVADNLRTFLDGVQADATYLASEEARSVISRIESGEEGIEKTAEYQRVRSVVSKYAPVGPPKSLPTAYNTAVTITDEILNSISREKLDAALDRIVAFDPTLTVEGLSTVVEGITSAIAQLESATGESFNTVGEVITAYENALSSVEAGRKKLESARSKITDALAEQGIKESDLPDTIAKANESIATLESTIREIDEGLPQIDEGIRQIDEGLAEIDRLLSEGADQLEAAKTELAAYQRTYEQSTADVLMEFASIDEELARAYAELEENQGYDQLCNQFLLWFEDGVDPEETLQAVEAALGDVAIKSDFTFERSSVKNRIDVNLKPIGTMSTFIPALYFAVLLVIVFLFMSLIIRQCRREIGILRALGFPVSSVRGLFCGVNLVVSLVAVIVGLGLGMFFAWFVGDRYINFFVLPFMTLKIDWIRAAVVSLAAIAVGQLATVFSTGIVARISPAEAMSRPAPVTVRTSGLAGKITRRFSPMTAFSITTIFRNPVRFFFSSVCVAATIMLIYSSMAFFTSMDYILGQTYGDRIKYDCQIFYSEPVSDETLSKLRDLDYLEDVSNMPYYRTDISFGDESESTLITAVDGNTELVGVTDKAGQPLSLDLSDDGIILEEHMADQLGAQVGDRVLVDGRVSMQVEGISFQCINRNQFISPQGAARLGAETVGSVICRIDEKDEQELLGYLVEQDDYLYTVFTRLSYQGSIKQLKSYDFAAWIIVCFAVCVGFIVVLNTSRTNILEKKKELCILRTLGFQPGEVSRSWFSQNILQYILAVILGFPLGGTVARIALERLSTATREYVYANTPVELLITAAFVFAYILLSHLIAMHDMKTWDMVESVKEKE